MSQVFARRRILAALASLPFASTAFAQGKKGGSSGATVKNGIAGTYLSKGLNADGTSYSGSVDVIQQGDAPVIYVIMPNGELHGTWDNGRALEKMIPQ